jgi:hypothetical protein
VHITNTEITNRRTQASGYVKAHVVYTISDGQTFELVVKQPAGTVDDYIIAKGHKILARARDIHASNLVANRVPIAATEHFTADEVCRAYLREGLKAPTQDAWVFLVLLVGTYLQGLTDSQVIQRLNITPGNWQVAKERGAILAAGTWHTKMTEFYDLVARDVVRIDLQEVV